MTAFKGERRKGGEYLSTLARGLSVLRSFTKEQPEMTLSEVAAATQLSPAVARRCLYTLVDLGYVGRKGKLFLLTPEVLRFASAFIESMNLEEVVQPHLQKVRDKTGDSTSLAVLSGFEILYLVHVSTERMIRLDALGRRLTEMADIDGGEFDFDSDPALGGPEEPMAAGSNVAIPEVVDAMVKAPLLITWHMPSFRAYPLNTTRYFITTFFPIHNGVPIIKSSI